MAGKRKYTDAPELVKKIDEYFDSVDTEDVPPIWEELLLYLGITRNTWESYRDPVIPENIQDSEKVKYIAISDAIKKAEGRFTAELAKYGLRHPNKQAMAMFLLKQKHYGGYTDKQEIEHKDLKIDVKINGIAGNPFG